MTESPPGRGKKKILDLSRTLFFFFFSCRSDGRAESCISIELELMYRKSCLIPSLYYTYMSMSVLSWYVLYICHAQDIVHLRQTFKQTTLQCTFITVLNCCCVKIKDTRQLVIIYHIHSLINVNS
jgi:hypothetical protein